MPKYITLYGHVNRTKKPLINYTESDLPSTRIAAEVGFINLCLEQGLPRPTFTTESVETPSISVGGKR